MHHLLEQKSPVFISVSAFFEAVAQFYNDSQRPTTAEAALHALQQGQWPVEDYIFEFPKWSADTGWSV